MTDRNDSYADLQAKKPGGAYSDDQLLKDKNGNVKTLYKDPIDRSPGRPAGVSRKWGDASPEVQKKVIEGVKQSAVKYGLSERETAIALSMVRAESGYNPDAAAGPSTAAGLAQFTNDTAADFGIAPTNRFDIPTNSDAFIRLFLKERDKAQTLSTDKRFETFSDADKIYAFHHEGRNSSPDTIHKFLTDTTKYNPSLRANINSYADKAQQAVQSSPATQQKSHSSAAGSRNVNINKRTAVHAQSNGMLTTQDVCKVPGKVCTSTQFVNIAESKDADINCGYGVC